MAAIGKEATKLSQLKMVINPETQSMGGGASGEESVTIKQLKHAVDFYANQTKYATIFIELTNKTANDPSDPSFMIYVDKNGKNVVHQFGYSEVSSTIDVMVPSCLAWYYGYGDANCEVTLKQGDAVASVEKCLNSGAVSVIFISIE